VNNVGVNLNTASASLLKYVSGINASLARKIVKYRDEKGKISSREELTGVPGMGPKSFEQCAGFLKIPESGEPLDNTWVHPENYEVARIIRKILTQGHGGTGENSGTTTVTANLTSSDIDEIRKNHDIGDTTLNDIVEELKKPNRDPRDGYPKPIMQKGVLTFEDLHEGMTVTGKIKNVVDFGAFVDLGIKETALVHISELSDSFVKDPMDVVKVGDVLEFRILNLDRDRKRIGLTRKKNSTTNHADHANNGDKKQEPKKVLVKAGGGRHEERREAKPQGASSARPSPLTPRPSKEDDGTMYNPFADAFKKMKDKKK
jgi:uncharacterized protein